MKVKIIEKKDIWELQAAINDFIANREVCSVDISSHAYMAGYSPYTYYVACILFK